MKSHSRHGDLAQIYGNWDMDLCARIVPDEIKAQYANMSGAFCQSPRAKRRRTARGDLQVPPRGRTPRKRAKAEKESDSTACRRSDIDLAVATSRREGANGTAQWN